MAAIPAAQGEVWQLRIEGRQEGQQVINVMHFRAETASDDVQTRLFTAILTCFITTLLPKLSSQYKFERLIGKRVSPDVGPDVIMLDETSVLAQGNAAALPSYASAVLSIRTTRAGRSGRGRMFIGGIPELATTNSAFDPASEFWLALIAFVACVGTKFLVPDVAQPNQWSFGVMSRKLGGVKPPFAANGYAPYTSIEPKSLVATTRSRKVGHGS